MREGPILFSGPMVRAILNGTKSQTRRVVKPQPDTSSDGFARVKIGPHTHSGPTAYLLEKLAQFSCPYGQPGDRLWVRETWLEFPPYHFARPGEPREVLDESSGVPRRNGCAYRADTTPEGEEIRADYGYQWKPSIHMPRWASRLTLEVTGVRVERLQDISEEDAEAEGIVPRPLNIHASTARGGFRLLWDSLNAKRGHGWDVNPWVWAIEFKVLRP